MPKHFVLYLKKKIIFPLVAFIISLIIILHFNGYLQINELLIILKTKQNFSKETEEYINRFDPQDYMMAGVDFFNPRYSPQRLNKPIEEIDRVYDYPFKYLQQIENKLQNVNRYIALKGIFEKITEGSRTELDRHLAVLDFLHKAAHANIVQPMYPDRKTVYDPIILLELGEMRCGHIARVAVDLFDAAGYSARLLQVHGHVTAEIFYNGKWHLFEADIAGGPPIMINDQIPSVEELSKNPFLIDKVPTSYERLLKKNIIDDNSINDTEPMYLSYSFFSSKALSKIKASYYYKTATRKEAANSKLYGWEYYKTDNQRWSLTNFKPKWEPSLPMFKDVSIEENKFVLEWEQSNDKDNDLLGYRVYISTKSRGWNYKDIEAPERVKKYFFGGWNPQMYDKVFKEPPSDLGLIETPLTKVEIPLSDEGVEIFVTIMAYDRHGELVGRSLYNQSVELKLYR